MPSPGPSDLKQKGSLPLHLLIIAAFGLLVYSNTFDVPFQFDDRAYIVNNPIVKDFGYFIDTSRAEGLYVEDLVKRYLRTRYVSYLSFWMNYKLGGLNVWGYHAVNLSVHVANALLLYVLVVLTFRTPLARGSGLRGRAGHIALFSALLFVVHPVGTEAVTYVTQRFVSTASMFYLLSLTAYIKSRLSGKRWPYLLSLLSAVLAMKSKEVAFTLPPAIALYELIFFRGEILKRVVFIVPLVLVMLIIPLSYLGEGTDGEGLFEGIGEATRLQTDMPRLDYLMTQFRVVVTYIRLLVLPVGQNFDYDFPVMGSFLDPEVLFSFVSLCAVLAVGVYLFRRGRERAEFRLVSFGLFWFFLALSVESSVIPISEIICEYRAYLPSMGLSVAVVTLLFAVAGGAEERWRLAHGAVMAALLTVVLAYSGAAYARNAVWRTETGLWEDAVAKSPLKARPHNNLGLAYEKQGRYGEAAGEYLAALEINPGVAKVHNNLGVLYQKQGRHEEAEGEYVSALAIEPYYAEAHINLGILYYGQGRHEEAEGEYVSALAIEPGHAEARKNLAMLYEKQGRYDEAVVQYLAALKVDPDNDEAHNNLGVVYERQGRYEEAAKEFQAAVRIDPNNAMAHNNLGVRYFKWGRYEDAVREFQAAAGSDPDNAEISRNLKRAFGLMEKERRKK
jgi:tetratricopeptide (TPR) repeat protein